MALEEIRNNRISKIDELKKSGPVFPIESNIDATISEVFGSWEKYTKKTKSTSLAGRVMAKRGQGALVFADIFDGTATMQILLKKDEIDEEAISVFESLIDIGDFVKVEGTFFETKRGEKTILVSSFNILSKSLRPLPEKWEGIKDPEIKMRQRYLHLLTDEHAREIFVKRIFIIDLIRKFLQKANYLEVETPMFHPLYGGASAIPFKTKYEALDSEFYLRISPELYLKRLLVAGFPKVFELNRNFRNEGIDVTHSPEFTMLEFYSAYETAKDQMNFTEKLIKHLVEQLYNKSSFENNGNTISVKEDFAVIPYFDLIRQHTGITHPHLMEREEAALEAERLGVKVEKEDSLQKIWDNIYKKHCRPKLIDPTFIIDYPASMLPLAKKKEENSNIVDAFQLVMGGVEVVKAFSELNDPLDQRKRFEEQEKSKKLGEKDAQSLDEDFLEAMEYGMPPGAGVGIGIDRLVMLLTDTHNIRDVILFPTLKPKK